MLRQSDGTYALPFGYTGYLKESIADLYYTGSRSYSAQDGRFMSRDQYRYMDYKNPATLNLYAYAWNNPLRYFDFDFDGHESIGEKSYLERSLEMVVLGNFSEESTLLGLAILKLAERLSLNPTCLVNVEERVCMIADLEV